MTGSGPARRLKLSAILPASLVSVASSTVGAVVSRTGRMGRTALFLLTAQALSQVAGYGFWLLVALSAPAETVGRVSAAVSLALLLGALASSGVHASVLVDISDLPVARASRMFLAALLWSAAASALMSSVALLANLQLELWPDLTSPGLWGPLVVFAAVMSSLQVMDAVSMGRGLSRLVVWRAATTSSIRLAAASFAALAAVVLSDVPLFWILTVSSAAALAAGVGRLRASGLSFRSAGGVSAVAGQVPPLLRRSGWNHVMSVVGRATPLLMPLLVTWRSGPEVNAGFFLAFQLAGAVMMVIGASGSAMLAGPCPLGELRHLGRRSVRLMLVLGLPAAAGTVLLGPVLLGLLGAEYEAAALPLLVFVVSCLPQGFSSLFNSRLRAVRMERLVSVAVAVQVVTTVTLSVVLPAGAGGSGVAYAFLVGTSVGAAVSFWLDRRHVVPLLRRLDDPSGVR